MAPAGRCRTRRCGRQSCGAACATASAIASPAERLEQACARLRAEPDLVDLPARLALFGLTRLPAARLAVLRALAAERDVHLFLLHPSPVLWEEIAVARAGRPPIVRRADDVTATLPANSLLASWGQDAREMQLVVAGGGADEHVDHHHAVAQSGDTLLARIQADVRADRAAPGVPLPRAPDARPLLDPADRSVQVHACHGRARQVEVARDAILHMLQDDPSLEPRDVIVMCPDIETFAPLIHATFGVGALHADDDDPDDALVDTGLPDLRVRLADRALRQTNPVLGVVAQLLDLTGARLTASQVLDLADRDPVRRRFGFDDDDLTRIQEWVADGGIRWGLDAAHRAPFKLESLAAGTWRAGLDRVLLGVAMTEEGNRLFEGVLRARRRRERRDRPRRPLRRARRPARRGARLAERREVGRGVDRGDRRGDGLAHDDQPEGRLAARRAAAPARRRRSTRPAPAAAPTRRPCCRPRCARCSPSDCRAGPRARTSAPAT